jgi:hypothetical protein
VVPPSSVLPHDCGILAVDPANTSGWAIWSRGALVAYGECDLFDGSPDRVIARFCALVPGPHVLVIERPFQVRFANQTSIGAADKVWRELAKRQRVRRVVRVYPATWRARVLGQGWARAPRDKVRAREQYVATWYVAAQGGEAPAPGPDASAAILIGRFGSHAGEVQLALLPKAKRRAA